jgi:TPR repeat protein
MANRDQAARLFVQAAEQGEARGLYQAALMHLSGQGLPENIDKAETFLRKAAKQNYLPAIIRPAQLYTRCNGSSGIFEKVRIGISERLSLAM